jgi:hypothetical protein
MKLSGLYLPEKQIREKHNIISERAEHERAL